MKLPNKFHFSNSLISVVLSGTAFAVYAATLFPTVSAGDSGELIAVAHRFGIAHAPGYPLFTLLGHLFTFIPWGKIAWRVNLLSAFCDAAAVGFLFLLVESLTENFWASVLSALMFAFSPLVWNYAIQAEVFGLNNLFVILVLYLALKERFYLLCFTIGLGLTNQQTFLFAAAPALALSLGLPKTINKKGSELLKGAALIVLGMLPYLYLPIAASRHPGIMWGDPSTWGGFLWHILRKDYGTFSLLARDLGDSGFFNRLGLYFADLSGQTLHLGILLATYGIFCSFKKNGTHRSFWRWLSLMYFGYLLTFTFLSKFPLGYLGAYEMLQRFWQQANIPIFIWLGLGLSFLAPKITPRGVLITSLLLAGLQLVLNFKESDQSKNTTFERYGRTLLSDLPQDTFLLIDYEFAIYPIYYLQTCENFRPDVKLLLQGALTPFWMRSQLSSRYPQLKLPESNPISVASLIKLNLHRVPLWVAPELKYVTADEIKSNGWEIRPKGLAFEITSKTDLWNLKDWMRETEHKARYPLFADLYRYHTRAWEFHLWTLNWQAERRRAKIILDAAFKNQGDSELVLAAAKAYDLLDDRRFNLPPEVFKDMGIARSLLRTPKAQKKAAEAFKTYLSEGPENDPERAQIEKFISAVALGH